MEQINLSNLIRTTRLDGETPQDWLRWALIKSVTQAGRDNARDGMEALNIPARKEGDPDTVIDVEFKINGVELKFSEILTAIVNSFNADVEQTARKFVKDEVRKATDKLWDVTSEFEQRLAQVGDDFAKEIIRCGVSLPSQRDNE